MTNLDQLQAQLMALQSQIRTNPVVTPAQVQPSLTPDALRDTIREVVKAELVALAQKSTSEPVVDKAPGKDYLMFAIGSVLSNDEQQWLAQENRHSQASDMMARFILTDDGRSAVKAFMQFFKESAPAVPATQTNSVER